MSSFDLASQFNPDEIEARCYKRWESAKCFSTDWREQTAPPFVIHLPPPNVTGTLHMGHAFNQTVMDALIRYQRMLGNDAVWIPGTDHAGIATQMVVERQIATKGETRESLGREIFIERIWEWKKKSGNTITEQMRRLGASCDWSREYFTMDSDLVNTVTSVFVQLYQEGLIYRGQRLVNWDPVLGTAVSDLEVLSQEESGYLWHIRYPLIQESGHVTIATTRPETLFGDTAVMVHPQDPRYQHLIGKQVTIPLSGRNIPIIADESVDIKLGTGCVKVTPAHDFNDYAVGQRHQLDMISIMDTRACLNDQVPEEYRGLSREKARQQVIIALREQGFLEKEEPHRSMIPRGDRSNSIIEPLLTYQWFVATQKIGASGKSLAMQGIEAFTSQKIRFHPENWINTYRQWMDNIQDWCISRQIWWGHPIPAWYTDNGEIIVAHNEAEAKAQAKAKGYMGALRQDRDVLDTWFSAALVPFSTLGWSNPTAMQERGYARYLPSSVLVTGFDIIFFWVARMVMMTCHFTGKVPFREVYVHGLIRDAEGKKMSKSKGNTLDPVDLIDGTSLAKLLAKRTEGLMNDSQSESIRKKTEQEYPNGIPAYGADALRFTMAAYASLGRNINFDLKRCEGYRNFCNKLWNAVRFVLKHCEGTENGIQSEPVIPGTFADRWIISRLQSAEAEVAVGFAQYRLDQVAQTIYHLVWDEYCDWYLELAKVQLQKTEGTKEEKEASERTAIRTRRTLLLVQEAILRLAHPIIPFITEELWQSIKIPAGKKGEHLCHAPYPISQPSKQDPKAEQEMALFQSLTIACRQMRSTLGVAPSVKADLLIQGNRNDIETFIPYFRSLARLSSVDIVHDLPHDLDSPQSMVGDYRLMLKVPIDPIEEKARIAKELVRVEQEVQKSQAKLSNPQFIEKAPAAVITQEKERLASSLSVLGKLQARASLL